MQTNKNSSGETPSGIYQHYKGSFYEIIAVGLDSESHQQMVVYKAIEDSKEGSYPAGSIWIRPLSMFLENVTVDGQTIARFKHIKS